MSATRPGPTHQPLRTLGLICLLLAGAAFRIIPLTDNRFHPDEALFSTLARLVASGRDPWLAHTALLVDKPPLFYYTLSGAVLIAGGSEIALRLPALLFSILTVAFVARLAWRLWRSWMAVMVATLVSALSPFAILFSPTVFSDPQYVMWLFASLVVISERQWGWGGILIGLAVASKQSASFFIPLVLLVGLNQLLSADTRLVSVLRYLLRFGTGLGLVLLCVVAWDQLRAPATSFWISAIQANNPGRLVRSSEVWARANAWLVWASAFTGSRLADATLLPLACAVLLELASGRRNRASANTMLLMAVLIAYVAAIWFVAFPLLDRYLLPVVYLSALLCGRGAHLLAQLVSDRHNRRGSGIRNALRPTIAIGLAALLLPGAVRASHSDYLVGGDHGAYTGIDAVANYLSGRPMGTVVYAHGLGWMLDYYLFDAYVYRSYFQGPGPLTDDLRAFGSSKDERYLALASAESATEIADAIQNAGFRLVPVEVGNMRSKPSRIELYRVEHMP